jgi:very-short-patch-repair endonuclease
MATPKGQKRSRRAWELAERQHGVIARHQLLALGFSKSAIRHRLGAGRLHRIHRGVYAAGRRQVDRKGEWLAAVLACGEGAVLSHFSAGALWGLVADGPATDVTVHAARHPRHAGIRLHRVAAMVGADIVVCGSIPTTSPTRTLIDLGTCCSRAELERAVNEADKLDLVNPERLRGAVEQRAGERGIRPLRAILDRATFALTDSELERRFLPIARSAGLPKPETGARVNGFKVDFLWRELSLIVETDGLRYHRTPAQQARDRRRDAAHAAAGLTTLRFTHAQIAYEREWVLRVLREVARRLAVNRSF